MKMFRDQENYFKAMQCNISKSADFDYDTLKRENITHYKFKRLWHNCPQALKLIVH